MSIVVSELKGGKAGATRVRFVPYTGNIKLTRTMPKDSMSVSTLAPSCRWHDPCLLAHDCASDGPEPVRCSPYVSPYTEKGTVFECCTG